MNERAGKSTYLASVLCTLNDDVWFDSLAVLLCNCDSTDVSAMGRAAEPQKLHLVWELGCELVNKVFNLE